MNGIQDGNIWIQDNVSISMGGLIPSGWVEMLTLPVSVADATDEDWNKAKIRRIKAEDLVALITDR